MPDPIASSSFSPDLSCNLEDDRPLVCQSEAASSTPASVGSAAASSTAALVQRFSASAQPAFVAATPLPKPAGTTPRVVTLRPDQVDLQTGIPRIQGHATLAGVQLTAGVDVLNANAHLGSLNGDGSRGENVGVAANLVGGELSIDYKGWSLTLGVAASLGGSISSGEGRDLDGDGLQERCFAMSLGPFTLGECDEL